MAGKQSHRRGPRAGDDDLRPAIMAAALREFSQRGYKDATMRGIARAAGVDAKLVHYYFGTKEELFRTAVGQVFRPERFAEMLRGLPADAQPRAGMGRQMLTMVLTLLDDPETAAPFLGIVRNLGTHQESRDVFLRFVTSEVIGRVAPALADGSGELRVSLVGSQVLGIVMARYVIGVPALADQSIDQLAAAVGPTLDRYLFGDLAGLDSL